MFHLKICFHLLNIDKISDKRSHDYLYVIHLAVTEADTYTLNDKDGKSWQDGRLAGVRRQTVDGFIPDNLVC